MNTDPLDPISVILVRAQQEFDLPYPLTQIARKIELVFVLCKLAPTLSLGFETECFQFRAKDQKRVIFEQSPLEHLLLHRSIRPSTSLFEILQKQGLAAALAVDELFYPVFLEISFYILQASCELLRQCKRSNNGLIFDSTVLARLRALRRLTEVPEVFGATVPERIESAVRYLVDNEVYPKGAIPVALFRMIRRRPSTLAYKLSRQAQWEPSKSQDILDNAREHDRHEESRFDLCFDQAPAESDVLVAESNVFTETPEKNRSKSSHFMPCAVAAAGALTSSQLENIIDAVADSDEAPAQVLGLMISGFCGPRQIANAYIQIVAGQPLLCTNSLSPQRSSEPKDLYVKVQGLFYRPIPARYQSFWASIQPSETATIVEGAALWLDKRFSVRLSKLELSLRTLGPTLFGYPWILAHLGFSPENRNPEAPESYTAVSWEIIRRSEDFLRRFDPSLSLAEAIDGLAVGSTLCPKLSVLRDMFRSWLNILEEAQRAFGNHEKAELLMNAVTAGMHALIILTTGIRNAPVPALNKSMLAGGAEYIKQKNSLIPFYVPKLVRAYLSRVEQIWSRFRTNFLTLTTEVNERSCYGFIDLNDGRILAPSAYALKQALQCDSRLAPYAQYHDHFLRHFTNSILRAAGYPEAVVRDFHHHRSGPHHPIRPTNLSSAFDSDLRDQLGAFLLKELGL